MRCIYVSKSVEFQQIPLNFCVVSIFRYPELPTLLMANKSYLPMELVDIEPMRITKITEEECALVCKNATCKPVDYRSAIMKARTRYGAQECESDPFIQAWKMNVSLDMLKLPARVLPSPNIVYTPQFRVRSNDMRTPGVWSLTSMEFHEPGNFPEVWAMVNLSSLTEGECRNFYVELHKLAMKRGMKCPEPTYDQYNLRNQSMDAITKSFLIPFLKTKSQCRFLLVILPSINPESTRAYNALKSFVRRLHNIEMQSTNVCVCSVRIRFRHWYSYANDQAEKCHHRH
jgi:hypothetical protein